MNGLKNDSTSPMARGFSLTASMRSGNWRHWYVYACLQQSSHTSLHGLLCSCGVEFLAVLDTAHDVAYDMAKSSESNCIRHRFEPACIQAAAMLYNTCSITESCYGLMPDLSTMCMPITPDPVIHCKVHC